MKYMFYGCSSLKKIFANSNFVTTRVEKSGFMFTGCTSLEGGAGTTYNSSKTNNTYAHVDGGEGNPGYFTGSVSVAGSSFQRSNFSDATKIVFDWLSDYDVSKMEDKGTMGTDEIKVYKSGTEYYILSHSKICMTGSLSNMFNNMSKLTSIEFKNFDTEAVTNMSSMFEGCKSLTSLNLSGFSTGRVTDMNSMFDYCKSLTSLDLSGFSTGSVINMNYLFKDCSSLTSLNLSGFSTGNVTKMSAMFHNCSGLTSLNLSGFSTGKVTDMSYMFYGCSGLTSIDLSGFSTGSVTNMYYMFYICSSLKTIYASSNFTTTKVNNANGTNMFYNCKNLKGGAGTGYQSSQTGKTYARIDGVDGKPGYFTEKK